ncbi:DUF3010 family protein [Amphritea sp.]|uniref:DUF3010 family protein n=1 Tax=Amphritea sp. TaxID=1872502 RepID=UPI0025C2D47A|nr:DUF3010 family protein [Amphritea sp.]
MRVCGVELKGNDAVICLMVLDQGLYTLPDCRVKKLSISDSSNRDELSGFQFNFIKLMQDYNVDSVVIRERMTKGKFAGGATSFRLEAAIQLASEFDVSLLSASKAKEVLKDSRVILNFKDTGMKQFQELAFMTAFAFLESGSH